MKRLLIFLSIFAICFFSIIEAKAQTRKSVSGAEVTGTFRDKSGSEFKILALGKGKLRVAFSGVYLFKMSDGGDLTNVGEAMGEAEITGDVATF